MTKNSATKRALLVALLIAACMLLSACYMEPDRVVDNQGGLTTDDQIGFDNVITPTPEPTATPTPKPTSNEVDWSAWDFGNDTATNPPSIVQPTAQGSIVSPTKVPAIVTATVSTSATSTPRPTTSTSASTQTTTGSLKVGSEGSDVKRLQQQLKNLGYYTGSVDGKFGQGTESAVRDFQAAHGLSVDGKAGRQTQEKLYSGSAKKKTAATVTAKPTSRPSSGTTTTATNPPSSYTNGKTDIYLEPGSGNAKQIKILQNRLIVLGYLTGTADGEYGATTTAAVKAFQKRNGLYDDGIAGPDTLEKLYSSSAKKASSSAGHLGSIRPGANGDMVRSLQKDLRTLNYYNGSVDGDYGTGTTDAVKAFQKDHGLTADGIAGKSTLNAIENALNGGTSSGGGSSSSSSSNPTNYGKTASSGGYKTLSTSSSSSSNVNALQAVLASNGYYNGTPDGKFGSGTEAAVRKYQQAKGLRVTGMAGPTTQRLLYGSTSESGSYKKLQLGSSGSSVKTLQYALYELKYYDGDITGKYDAATENAVKLFQEVNGLYIDGIAGQDTQRKLFSSYAKPCDI